ncbi:MAG: guanitoxin biosynthesis MBL fold metallo-hydrolase GntH [Planctomycetota bacterium]
MNIQKTLTQIVGIALGVALFLGVAKLWEGSPARAQNASPVAATADRDVYYPGTEDLGPNEMRVICCGSGMPMPRLKQAAACFVIELGNGDKFIFDMGNGSFERIHALGIPLDYLDKVFITHPHMDHMADLATFYMTGPQNNRSKPLRVWGPGGGGMRPEWGMKAAMGHMEKMWAWMSGTLVGTIDSSSMKLEVTEYDWSKVNNVIYEDNGVVIRSLPAVHFEGTASFILEWNGLRLAFSGDTLPNKWWIEHTKGIDFAIHECFFTPEMAMTKWGFTKHEALNAVTTVHANATFFGKVMAMTRPKHAVAYHFQNDADTLPVIMRAVEQVYDGPVDYAQDFMVWNITKDGVRTRMAVPNPEAYPTPSLVEKKVEAGADRYQTPDSVLAGWPEEFDEVAQKIYADFNKKHGTRFEFKLKK